MTFRSPRAGPCEAAAHADTARGSTTPHARRLPEGRFTHLRWQAHRVLANRLRLRMPVAVRTLQPLIAIPGGSRVRTGGLVLGTLLSGGPPAAAAAPPSA